MPGERGDVDDAAVAALAHAGQQAPGQLGGRGQQYLQEIRMGRPVVGDEGAGYAVTGVVDQPVDLQVTLFQCIAQCPWRGRVSQVVRQHGDLDGVSSAKFGGESFQPISAARGQHQVMAKCGKLPGERGTDAG